MRVTMLATLAAVAFAAAIGSVSAGQFTTLKGVKAVPMSSTELRAVKGMDHHFTVTNPANDATRHDTDQHQDANDGANFVEFVGADGRTRMVSPAYLGLSKACAANDVIDGPGFLC
jgi:hypothetical protein